MTTRDLPLRPSPYALEIPALWTSVDFQSENLIDEVVAAVVTSVPDTDMSRLTSQLRVAQHLALSFGITKCHAYVREIDETVVILTLACAIVRVVPEPSEDDMELMMRVFRTADGVDFEVLPMMSVVASSHGEILRAERVIPASPERMLWANRMITYGIVHPSRETMAVLVGTSPNVELPDVGDVLDDIAKSFFWIG
jgi:hypothetical protein